MGDLPSIKELTYMFGPFAIFTLIALAGARHSFRVYSAAEDGGEQQKVFRWYFIGSVTTVFLLIVGCISWWLYSQPPCRVILKGSISFSGEHDILLQSRHLHFQELVDATVVGRSNKDRQIDFMADVERLSAGLQEVPIMVLRKTKAPGSAGPVDASAVDINRQEKPGKVWSFKIKVAHYRLILVDGDFKLQNVDSLEILLPVKMSQNAERFAWLSQAHANNVELAQAAGQRTVHSGAGMAEGLESGMMRMAKGLQRDGATVEERLYVLDWLREAEPGTLDTFMRADVGEGPVAATMLDMTRHTDPLVANWSDALVRRYDLAGFVGRGLRSDDEPWRKAAVGIMARMGHRERQALVEGGFVTEKALRGVREQGLIPTASEQGDRYYVKASWNPRDRGRVFNCLTQLFNDELLAKRSIKDERRLMAERNGTRYVYWYSDDWAIYIAKKIGACGATATFVNGKNFKACSRC